MVVIATKLYVRGGARERALSALDALVDDTIGDLDVDWEIGVRADEFPAVTVTGTDATAARNALRAEWGEIDPHRTPGEVYTGTLEHWDVDGFVLDAGERVRIPADGLELGPGTPGQVRTRFGLVQHLPIQFLEPPGSPTTGTADATDASDAHDGDARGDGNREGNAGNEGHDGQEGIQVQLADRERDRLYGWTRGPGRVNVNSATRAEVRATVNRAGHARDIVTVERLGLLEQSIVCGEDTDPPGLLASIGDYLPAELLAVVP